MQEIASLTPIYGGISYDRLEETGLQWPCPDRQSRRHACTPHRAFRHRGGALVGAEYKPSQNLTDAGYPLMLTLGRSHVLFADRDTGKQGSRDLPRSGARIR